MVTLRALCHKLFHLSIPVSHHNRGQSRGKVVLDSGENSMTAVGTDGRAAGAIRGASGVKKRQLRAWLAGREETSHEDEGTGRVHLMPRPV